MKRLIHAHAQGGSISHPRVSPDGRYLLNTWSAYGTLPVWHKDADLYCIDLQVGSISRIDTVNSEDVESYHSWSGNNRWLVFSSRRDDGLYTRPYISYVDADGKFHRPFMLPQKNPKDFYDSNLFSYIIPEFLERKVSLRGRDVADFANDSESVHLKCRKF